MPDEIETPALSDEPTIAGTSWVTLVEGSSFCVCEQTGDISRGTPQGIFVRDTRILSRWELLLDGRPLQPLAVIPTEPFAATFVGRAPPTGGSKESALLLRRDRFVGDGMREDLKVENYGPEDLTIDLDLAVGADFADLFEVKEGLGGESPAGVATRVLGGELRMVRNYGQGEASRGVRVVCSDAIVRASGLRLHAVVPPRGSWQTVILAIPTVNGQDIPPRYPVGRPLEETGPVVSSRAWRASSPVVRTANARLQRTFERSRQDLGALRIFDPEQPDVAVVAAGAPWFMALFGRDSLLTSWMTLPIDQRLALGTLKTLARLQGAKVDPASEEEPGRILHEVRLGADAALALGGSSVYYGTADATPLFVMLLGELRRWGLARDEVDALLPHADRALAWITDYGDRDGDLLVEYQRATERGLLHQGWKDSHNGVTFADGTLAQPPIALCEVQGYAYSAFLARAHFAWEVGDDEARQLWVKRADRLREAFNERFWLPDRGWYAMALDHAKQPVDSLASNMGHCLWTGIVDEDKAPLVAERLMSPEVFSGWGVRTLATSMGAFNPISYHNGSVWPHDNALVAAGLMRYGFVEEAQRVATAILDAADAFGGRLPELFCGFDRSEYPRPVPFPTSCSPQAWAAAAPVHLLRTLLRFEPWVPHGKAWLAPALPPGFGPMGFENIPLGGSRISLEVLDGSIGQIDGLPAGLELITEPREAITGRYDSWQMGY